MPDQIVPDLLTNDRFFDLGDDESLREFSRTFFSNLADDLDAESEAFCRALRGGWTDSDVRSDGWSYPCFVADPGAPTIDPVTCSVFAAPEVRPGTTMLIQVFAHLRAQADAVKALAMQVDQNAAIRGVRTLPAAISRESLLTFSMKVPQAVVKEPCQNIRWLGMPEGVSFEVVFAPNAAEGDAIGTVVVSQDSVPIGHIKFKISIRTSLSSTGSQGVWARSEPWKRYASAFISYALPDRAEVMKRVQMLGLLRPPIRYFLDLISLSPGERWERALYRYIDASDVFFLFWSTAAKRSRWVMKEVEYAMARKKGDDSIPPEVVPVIIEGPPPVPPPPALIHLHFNDKLTYFMK
jgi:hypothetical protein